MQRWLTAAPCQRVLYLLKILLSLGQLTKCQEEETHGTGIFDLRSPLQLQQISVCPKG